MRYSDIILEATTNGMPLRSFKRLYHVGTLNVADKADNSLEGAGLSVSLHPDEWQEIARLSGFVWTVTRAGNRFLDVHKLRKADKETIIGWGIEAGYLARQSLWKVRWYDEEDEGYRWMMFPDLAAAQEEAQGYGVSPIEMKNGVNGTAKLWQRARHRPEALMPFDLLCPIFAEDHLRIDGVWWADRLSPESLSAPRGVIVPSQIQFWHFEKIVS